MTKRLAFFTVSLATAMALTGCSGAPAPSSTDSQVAETTPSRGAENSIEPLEGVLSPQQVETIASNLLEGEDAVQVIGNDQMQKQLAAAKDADISNNIKPENCAELNAKYTVTDLTSSISATSTSTSESLGKVIQIFSLTDESTRKNVAEALTLDDLSGCEIVTIEEGGEKLAAERQILPLDITAEQSLAMSTMMDVGGGQTLSSVAIQALEGNNFVLVTLQTGSLQPAELAAQAAVLADEAIAEIEALG